jgi:hypothetical protein
MTKANTGMTQHKPRTNWVKPKAPEPGLVQMKEVEIPNITLRRKGKTKYDEIFLKLLEFKNGVQADKKDAELIRRSLQRFIIFRGLKDTVRLRSHIDEDSRKVTVWLEKKEQK